MTYEEAIKSIDELFIKQYQGKHLLTGVALRMAVEALEKQVPKNVVEIEDEWWEYKCPVCGRRFTSDESLYKVTHCTCGQAISWEEVK